MEKEQIVKELEGLSKFTTCPDYIKRALSLILEQEKRIEYLENICESYAIQYGTAADKEVFLKQERAATVRKMQEAIKERCIKGGIYPAFVKNVVEAVAKELLEDAPPQTS